MLWNRLWHPGNGEQHHLPSLLRRASAWGHNGCWLFQHLNRWVCFCFCLLFCFVFYTFPDMVGECLAAGCLMSLLFAPVVHARWPKFCNGMSWSEQRWNSVFYRYISQHYAMYISLRKGLKISRNKQMTLQGQREDRRTFSQRENAVKAQRLRAWVVLWKTRKEREYH